MPGHAKHLGVIGQQIGHRLNAIGVDQVKYGLVGSNNHGHERPLIGGRVQAGIKARRGVLVPGVSQRRHAAGIHRTTKTKALAGPTAVHEQPGISFHGTTWIDPQGIGQIAGHEISRRRSHVRIRGVGKRGQRRIGGGKTGHSRGLRTRHAVVSVMCAGLINSVVPARIIISHSGAGCRVVGFIQLPIYQRPRSQNGRSIGTRSWRDHGKRGQTGANAAHGVGNHQLIRAGTGRRYVGDDQRGTGRTGQNIGGLIRNVQPLAGQRHRSGQRGSQGYCGSGINGG